MPASYPGTYKTFSTKINLQHVVDASHPNEAQEEIVAVQRTLGINPHVSTFRGITYVDVKARLEDIESDYSLTTHTHSHATLTGLTADDHPQYLNEARHDVAGRHVFGAALGAPGVPTTAAGGDTASAGAGAFPAREDHRHGMPAFAAPAAETIGAAQAVGVAPTLSRSDHVHAMPAGAAAGASGVGDSAAEGTAATLARSDHRHAREGFGAVTAETSHGLSAANGVAATVARSDHAHGTPALTGTAAVTQAIGDAAAAGGSGSAARSDHRHGMPAFGTVSAMTTYGLATTSGTATTVSRSDHNHGTPPADVRGPTGVIVAYGGTAAPAGWLLCNGAAVSRTTYADLYNVISTRYGAGDGTTTFNVPDLRSRIPVGQATATAAVVTGDVGSHTHTGPTGAGSAHTHTGTSAAGSSHSHSVTLPSATGNESRDHTHNNNLNTSIESQNHLHDMASHVHSYLSPASTSTGANTGTPFPSASDWADRAHVHLVSGATAGASVTHTHTIGAGTIGSEASHTHGITVASEASHTHPFTSAATANVPTQSVNYIIKT